MANPQTENGYTPIANEIAEALMHINLSAYESRVLWFLFRKTYGWGKKTDWIALSQFSKCVGIDRRLVHRAIKGLSSKKMIVIERDDKGSIRYGFQKDYEKWKASSKKMTVIKRDDEVSSNKMTRLSSKEIPTKETITKETITKEIYTADFELFYNSYPKKRSKPAAFKEWKRFNGKRPPIEEIIKAIKNQIEWRERANGEFRPEWKDPERWIKKECWLDEVVEPESDMDRWLKDKLQEEAK